MRSFSIVLTLLLSPTLLPPAQGGSGRVARLVHRVERRCGYSCLQELSIDLGAIQVKEPGSVVAIRFCSKESLPIALLTSAAAPKYLISLLTEVYGYEPEQIVFLRSAQCLGMHRGVTPTEFWIVPKNGSPPSSIESIESSLVSTEGLGAQGSSVEGERDYRGATQKLIATLRARPGTVGAVIGYYYRRPAPPMRRRLREVTTLLRKSGLEQGRYFVRLTPWTGEQATDPPEREPRYPSFSVVEIMTAGAKR